MSRPLVIKIGGSTLGSADTTFRDVAELAKSGDVPVIVHGGGAEASRWLEAMSIPSRFERGLRVTDAAGNVASRDTVFEVRVKQLTTIK